MLTFLFIFLFGISPQDTTKMQDTSFRENQDTFPVKKADTALSHQDTVPKKRKKKKMIDTLLVIQKTDILRKPDTIRFYQGKKQVLYFGQIDDTVCQTLSIHDYLTDRARTKIFNLQPKRKTEDRFWIFYAALLPLLIVIFVRLNYYKYLSDLRRAFFNLTISQQLFREHELGFTLPSLLLNLNFVLTLGMYLYLLVGYFQLQLPLGGFWLWSFLCLLVTLVYTIKYVFLRLITFFFPISNEVNFYNFNVFLFNKILGMVLIFFILLMAFANRGLVSVTVYTSVSMMCLFVAYRFFRGMVIARNYLGFQKFHFFLYLCTLEIAPAFILIKLLLIWTGV